MTKKIIIILLSAFIGLSCQAQKSVCRLPLDSTQKPVKGATINYVLAKTNFRVTVTVNKISEYRGYYADYAESLLGLNNVIQENKTYYTLKDVSIEPVQWPDIQETYQVKLSRKQEKELQLSSAQNNLLIANENLGEAHCFVAKTEPIPDFFKNYADLSYTQTEDEFMDTRIIDGVVTQVPSNRTKVVSKSNQQKAQEAADAISKSRDAQYNLLSGEQETPYSQETISTMLNGLKERENNYLSLFKGLTLTDEMQYTFMVSPEGYSDLWSLFSLDPNTGFTTDHFVFDRNAYDQIYMLKLEPVIKNAVAADNNTKTKFNGFRYRKAVPVTVSLFHNKKVEHTFGTYNMSQYGTIQTLPKNQKDFPIEKIGFIY